MDILDILKQATAQECSDIFLVGGLPLTFKKGGRQLRVGESRLMPDDINALIDGLYEHVQRERVSGNVEDDFSFAIAGCGRFRANIFKQRGSLSAVIRIIRFGVPDPEKLGIDEGILDLYKMNNGLVLVTGPAGSGKTTTLACIIDKINSSMEKTIITMEDPIEIVHNHKQSIVIQREVLVDTQSFATGLRASLRESPDVLLLGEARDAETIEIAMTAAETGQLIFSSMHTLSASDTVDRIVDAFPEKKQAQIRAQLARVLKCVVCQKLVPTVDGGLAPVFEIMTVTPAVQNLIRENKTYQFGSLIQGGEANGMRSMNTGLLRLVASGRVSKETALDYTENPTQLKRMFADAGL